MAEKLGRYKSTNDEADSCIDYAQHYNEIRHAPRLYFLRLDT